MDFALLESGFPAKKNHRKWNTLMHLSIDLLADNDNCRNYGIAFELHLPYGCDCSIASR